MSTPAEPPEDGRVRRDKRGPARADRPADGERYDAIIVGAGMAGLAAGIRLAQYKERVLILERHALWGGLNSFYKRRGRVMDVGLHALTNYAPKGRRGVPLTKLLRQLRLAHADLKLGEQTFSEIAFPSETLRFSNDFALFESEVARAFPGEVDAFRALTEEVMGYDSFSPPDPSLLTRAKLEAHFSEPLLVEMLMLPMCYYGSAVPNDIAWYQFAILFKSFFDEGFARPEGGIRPLLQVLTQRYKDLGGQLVMRCGVERVLRDGERAIGVATDDGRELFADQVFSSAGSARTLALAGEATEPADHGQLSFTETMVITERLPSAFDVPAEARGHGATIVFFNADERFHYDVPPLDAPLGIDTRSGVICCPNAYAAEGPLAAGWGDDEGALRYTALANADFWRAFDRSSEAGEAAYLAAKQTASEALIDRASRFAPDPRPYEIDRDAFTPRTIEHFTGHARGAVYGAPKKHLDGQTPLEDLYLIGTDQGLLGVVGAMLSGISIANRYGLRPSASTP